MITFIVQQIEDIPSARLTPERRIWSNLTKDLLNTVHCDLDQVFSTLALWTFWTRKYVTVEGCPVYLRIFSSIPCLKFHLMPVTYLSVPSHLQVVKNQNCLQKQPNVPQVTKSSWMRTTGTQSWGYRINKTPRRNNLKRKLRGIPIYNSIERNKLLRNKTNQ